MCCGRNTSCQEGDQCCKDKWGSRFCAPSCYDTVRLDFNDFPGMEEIFENMCRGILRSGSTTPGEMILEHGKYSKSQKNRHRRQAGCRGRKGLKCAKLFGKGWECDEFPFASTVQGGTDAAAMCVPGTHNGAIGGIWGSNVRGKAKGTKLRFKIDNFDCSEIFDKRGVDELDSSHLDTLPEGLVLPQLEKRDGAILKNDSTGLFMDASVFGLNSTGGDVAMIIPLNIPEDFVGTFEINYKLESGTLRSGLIIDDDGEDYGEYVLSSMFSCVCF